MVLDTKIAIIPARGGSKRIPKKNSRNFLGKPIISYSIELAQSTGLFDQVIVSTDDQEIAEIARKFGADVPFLRSKRNSDDHATIFQAMEEVLTQLRVQGYSPTYFCCLFPTAPLLTAKRVIEGFQTMVAGGFDSVLTIQEFQYPIQRALKITNNGGIDFFDPEQHSARSQDLATAYHDAGQFYWSHVDKYLENKRFIADRTGWIKLSWLEAHDIDSLEDWEIAEMKFRLAEKTI